MKQKQEREQYMERRDTFSRSWIVTQSAEKMSQDELMGALSSYTWVGQLERSEKGGEDGYLHYQIYIENARTIRFSTLKKKLPNAHVEERRGSRKQAYDYVTKEETRVGEIISNGEIRLEEEQGKRNDLKNIVMLLEEGASLAEIQSAYPTQYLLYSNRIKAYLQDIADSYKSKYLNIFRQITTTYIWGETGVGKTRHVMDKYGYRNVYRVSNYNNSMWDTYEGEKIVLLEEFRSSIKIGDFLKWTEGYPLMLPARYQNKIACFETVYIVSNISLYEQYKIVQQEEPKTFDAFLRRIHYIWEMGRTDSPVKMPQPNSKRTADQLLALGAIDDDIF